MKFSSKSRYGMRAVFELGKNYNSDMPISNSKLASLTNVSEPYLEKIMSALKKNKIVISKQGLNGGYVLAVSPKDLSIFNILTALEGSLYTSECIEKDCKNKNCPNKNVFNFIYENINNALSKISLQDIIDDKSLRGV